jgi:hypothetical protein
LRLIKSNLSRRNLARIGIRPPLQPNSFVPMPRQRAPAAERYPGIQGEMSFQLYKHS